LKDQTLIWRKKKKRKKKVTPGIISQKGISQKVFLRDRYPKFSWGFSREFSSVFVENSLWVCERHKGPASFLNSGDCKSRGTQAGQVVVRGRYAAKGYRIERKGRGFPSASVRERARTGAHR